MRITYWYDEVVDIKSVWSRLFKVARPIVSKIWRTLLNAADR
jgi:hypothetical protein